MRRNVVAAEAIQGHFGKTPMRAREVSAEDFVAVITCPLCGNEAEEVMPADACVFFYECRGCKQLLRPNPGDCCVFCSFSDRKCPPCSDGNC